MGNALRFDQQQCSHGRTQFRLHYLRPDNQGVVHDLPHHHAGEVVIHIVAYVGFLQRLLRFAIDFDGVNIRQFFRSEPHAGHPK
jgi:hypothetical protein